MSSFATPAILLRRVDYGDYDLVLALLTLNRGKISVIAKSAKKSKKRFAGVLELFSVLQVVYSTGRGKGLPVLQEAVLEHPFPNIRSNIKKTAYASYWAELINDWMEEGEKQAHLYQLLLHVLGELDLGHAHDAALSILFQIRFMSISGLSPNLTGCGICRTQMERMNQSRVVFDLEKGSLVCEKCDPGYSGKIFLSIGTIKQLQWIKNRPLEKAGRIRFAPKALHEGLFFLESFVPYHLEKTPRSLTFLQQIRR